MLLASLLLLHPHKLRALDQRPQSQPRLASPASTSFPNSPPKQNSSPIQLLGFAGLFAVLLSGASKLGGLVVGISVLSLCRDAVAVDEWKHHKLTDFAAMESTSASPPRNSPTRVQPPQTTERDKDAGPINSTHRKISDIRHGIGEGVDRLLDESHRFKSAVRAAFEQFQLPRPAQELPVSQLLPALQYVVQRICDDLDAKAGKLVLRPITQEDIQGAVRSNSSLSLDPLLTSQQFERIARETLKRVALDRGKRLGLFMIGGIVAVHMAKGAVKKIPILGGPIGAIASVLVPTTLLGPAVGVAGALYL